MKSEKSCGAIVFRRGRGGMEFLVIQHSLSVGGHWDFPKGHVEAGETEQETALREVYEEAGVKVRLLEGFREEIRYVDEIHGVQKTVVFFVGEAMGNSNGKCDGKEVVDFCWLEYSLALEKLTYENAKQLLKKAELFLKKGDLKKIRKDEIINLLNLHIII